MTRASVGNSNAGSMDQTGTRLWSHNNSRKELVVSKLKTGVEWLGLHTQPLKQQKGKNCPFTLKPFSTTTEFFQQSLYHVQQISQCYFVKKRIIAGKTALSLQAVIIG